MFLQKNADAIAKMGVEMGIKNYVAPATRLNRLSDIRNIVGNNAYIISPGVGISVTKNIHLFVLPSFYCGAGATLLSVWTLSLQ